MSQRCPARRARAATAAAVLAVLLSPGSIVSAQTTSAPAAQPAPQTAPADKDDAALYRIFLRDGGMLASYGEFAQVGDTVVASIPVGGSDAAPTLHVLTIAAADVDWERTNAYVDAIRARRYAATRGEADFSAMSWQVAEMLNRVGGLPDAAQRLALAEAARQRLIEWPQQHYGYRAADTSQMVTWLDQVVSELRIAAGQTRFDLAFVATAPSAAPAVPLLPPPNLRERVEFGLIAARRTADPAGRASLLRAVLESLEPAGLDVAWVAAVRARASAELAAEARADRLYAALTDRVLARADVLARQADVRGIESLVRGVLLDDEKLGRSRPEQITALLTTLDQRVDAARRLRLARDAWLLRSAVLRAYWSDVRQGLDRLLGIRSWLEDVRQLAGPAPKSLQRLGEIAAAAQRELGSVRPPAEVSAAHATLQSASALAGRAGVMRTEALRAGSMDVAWQASSAAAGALMLLDQAVAELRRITRAPVPR
jgi:hypothetical protein